MIFPPMIKRCGVTSRALAFRHAIATTSGKPPIANADVAVNC